MTFDQLKTGALVLGAGLILCWTPNAGARPVVHEDSPAWEWSTMGNLQRGVTLASGRRVVVEPCRFAYLEYTGRIDWARTRPLKGDAYARRHGCDPRKYAFTPSVRSGR